MPRSLLMTSGSDKRRLHHQLGQAIDETLSLRNKAGKALTGLQLKLNYLRVVSQLPSYGTKCFLVRIQNSVLKGILLMRRGGLPIVCTSRITVISSRLMTARAQFAPSDPYRYSWQTAKFTLVPSRRPHSIPMSQPACMRYVPLQ